MKKNILGVLFLVFASLQAAALTDVEISGELDVSASVWNLPTGERGISAFGVPNLFLNLDAPLKDDNLLSVTFEGSEEKEGSTERFDVKVREAYLDVVSLFDGLQALRFGLTPQVWQEAQYDMWRYRFLGKDAWAITEKWKYQSAADLGLSFMSELPENLGEWALTVSNGEGASVKEAGPHKEVALYARFMAWSPWTFSLNYVRGNYDKYGEDVGIKERAQAMLTYGMDDSWLLGLEYFAATDPADAIRDLQMAEGVDVSAFSGEAIRAQGASLFMTVSTGPKAEVILRFDYLNPVVSETGRELQTSMIALAYQVAEDIRGALAVDYTHYGDEFAPGVRDRSKLAFAAQVLF